MLRVSLLLVLLCSLAPSCRSQEAAVSAPAQSSAAGTPTTTASARFTLPSGWTATEKPSLLSVQAPEPDTHIVFLEEKADTAAAAVAKAWAAYQPGFARPLKNTFPQPDREGWKDTSTFVYETSPNERAVVDAIAQRAGDTWTVVLLDGKEPTFEKRGAQVGLMLGSLRPKSYQREMFTGRKANALTPERIEQLRSFVEASMKQLDIPGVGLALIDGNKVVYEGGVGVKSLGKPDPIDANTLFMAASNTKGMTTLLLARLVDS